MQEMKPIKEGKVREIYDNGDSLIMVATEPDQLLRCDSEQRGDEKGHCADSDVKILVHLTKDILPTT